MADELISSNPNAFAADLARIEQIRRVTTRPYERASRDLVLSNANADFLLQFIDKLWKEYASALTSPKTADPCPHEDCHAAWRCTRCGEFRGECPPMHAPETPALRIEHKCPNCHANLLTTGSTQETPQPASNERPKLSDYLERWSRRYLAPSVQELSARQEYASDVCRWYEVEIEQLRNRLDKFRGLPQQWTAADECERRARAALRAAPETPVLPKLEFAEHCACCTRNKITVEVFGRPAQETSALPHASAALTEFMAQLGETLSMEDGATPADYLHRARDIREWCHDHQTALNFVDALKIAESVFEQYHKDQPKWWKRMDGTPILNDVAVRMAEAFRDAASPTLKASCAHNNQRQGQRGRPYCADCGEDVNDRELSASETASFDKALARSPRRVDGKPPEPHTS